MRILIVHASTHGHTTRIAERIAERLRQRGASVDVTTPPRRARLSQYDGVVVGARVHGTRYPWRLHRFVRRHRAELSARPSAFFSVSLLQLSQSDRQRTATEGLPLRSLPELGWTPDTVAVLAGALDWNAQYGWLAPLFKRLWRHTLGDRVDPSLGRQVFTDWSQVDALTDAFAALAERSQAKPDRKTAAA